MKTIRDLISMLEDIDNEGSIQSQDQFSQAYFEAFFFTEEERLKEEMDDINYDMISDQTRAEMISDCRQFQDENRGALEQAYEVPGYSEKNAGHDFWLTRNGHGAGFWDGDLPKQLGDELTNAAKKFGEVDVYLGDDGQIHAS